MKADPTIEDKITQLVEYASSLRMQIPVNKLDLWEHYYKLEPSYSGIEGSVFYIMQREKYDRIMEHK